MGLDLFVPAKAPNSLFNLLSLYRFVSSLIVGIGVCDFQAEIPAILEFEPKVRRGTFKKSVANQPAQTSKLYSEPGSLLNVKVPKT